MSLAKKPSTALSQDAEVGVKWNVQRGCRASHWRTLGCLWVASLSTMAWITSLPGPEARCDPRRSPQVDGGPSG